MMVLGGAGQASAGTYGQHVIACVEKTSNA
jgi:hypothetical protein